MSNALAPLVRQNLSDEIAQRIAEVIHTQEFEPGSLALPIKLQASDLDHSLVLPGGRPFRNGVAVNAERQEDAPT